MDFVRCCWRTWSIHLQFVFTRRVLAFGAVRYCYVVASCDWCQERNRFRSKESVRAVDIDGKRLRPSHYQFEINATLLDRDLSKLLLVQRQFVKVWFTSFNAPVHNFVRRKCSDFNRRGSGLLRWLIAGA